jgi:hypothetical protein
MTYARGGNAVAVTRRKIDTKIERDILTGMIVSDHYLREVIPLYSADLLEMTFAPIIASWCIEFYKNYEEAPRREIEDLYEHWAKTATDPEQIRFVKEFLATLSEEYERADHFNVPYLIDKTVAHFGIRAFSNLGEDLKFYTDKGDLDGCKEAYNEFRTVEKVMSQGIDPFDDEQAIQKAWEAKSAPLFQLPGKLGEMMNEQFTRESLVAMMGVAKIGKTWFLDWLSKQAHRQRCNVAYFQLGDLTEADYVLRTHITLAQRSNKKKYCGEILVPVLDCEHNQRDNPVRCLQYANKRTCSSGCYDNGEKMSFQDAVGYVPCTACQHDHRSPFKGAVWHAVRPPVQPLEWQEAYQNGVSYKKKIKAKGFRLATFLNDSCSMSMIDNQLSTWEEEDGFVADVIAIDYMDIAAPEPGPGDERFQENKKWKAARRLSQKRHACVLTLSQADTDAMDTPILTRKNFTTDRRKYDHVTAFYGLNQTPSEKKEGIMRIGEILVREGEFDITSLVTIGQCLAIGKAYLFSY